MRGIEFDGAADLAVLGDGCGFELSHTDLGSPAQPCAPPGVALAEPFLERVVHDELPGVRYELPRAGQ